MPTGVNTKFVGESLQKKPWTGPVIDLGASDCSDWYQQFFKGTEYIKLDLEQNPKKDIDIIADILNMPQVKSNTYGVVVFCETLEHLKNPFLAFTEINRILRPGGMLICTTVACWVLHGHPHDYFRFMPEGLRVLCDSVNLKVFHEVLFPTSTEQPSHCMIAAIKP